MTLWLARYNPEKKTPSNATKALNARVLRIAGCESIKVLRAVGGVYVEKEFTVPTVEPEDCRAHREEGAKAPASGEAGTVYARKGPNGPSEPELTDAAVAWLKANKPEALDSKVEAMFRTRGYGIVWTPPLLPEVPAHRARLGRGEAAVGRDVQPRP